MKVDAAIFKGYSLTSKSYQVLNKKTRKIKKVIMSRLMTNTSKKIRNKLLNAKKFFLHLVLKQLLS